MRRRWRRRRDGNRETAACRESRSDAVDVYSYVSLHRALKANLLCYIHFQYLLILLYSYTPPTWPRYQRRPSMSDKTPSAIKFACLDMLRVIFPADRLNRSSASLMVTRSPPCRAFALVTPSSSRASSKTTSTSTPSGRDDVVDDVAPPPRAPSRSPRRSTSFSATKISKPVQYGNSVPRLRSPIVGVRSL